MIQSAFDNSGTRTSSRFKGAGLLLLAGIAVVVAGCGTDAGRLATMPVTDPAASPAIVDGSTGGGGGDPETPIIEAVAGQTVTSPVTVAGGGQVVCGRHTLTIPAGAVKSDVEVTLVDLTDSQGYPCVQILPDNLHFKVKCTLESRVVDLQDPATSLMYWIHPVPHGRVVWSSVGGIVTSNGTAVSAGVGRTGIFAVSPAS